MSILAIVAPSGAGKTCLKNEILRCTEYENCVTVTTRPKRPDEVNGVDYYFVSEETFDAYVAQDLFVEHASHYAWRYGSLKSEYIKHEHCVCILTPHGVRSLRKHLDADITVVYLMADRRSRFIKMLERGDDIDYAYFRNVSDVGQFDGVEDEADILLDNASYELSPHELMQVLFEHGNLSGKLLESYR